MTREFTDPTLPNAFVTGLQHLARLTCDQCEGHGFIDYESGDVLVKANCRACDGTGSYEVGCGGAAERDINHSLAYCISEGYFVPLREVPLP